MKKILTFSALILLSSISILAQIRNVPCPVVEIVAPQSVTQPGEAMMFSALVKGETKTSELEFVWIVSAGTIIEGQNTSIITLATTPEMSGANVTAGVTIKGLPDNCANKFSEISPVAPVVIACGIPFHSYDKISWQNEMSVLQNLAVELSNQSDYQAYILLTAEKKESDKQIENHIRKMVNYLESIKIDSSRLTFAIESSDRHSTTIHVLRKDVELPSCEKCKIFRGKDLK